MCVYPRLCIEFCGYACWSVLSVFSSLDMSRSVSVTAAGQCRLAPLIQVILDCSHLYDYTVKLLFKLHSCESYIGFIHHISWTSENKIHNWSVGREKENVLWTCTCLNLNPMKLLGFLINYFRERNNCLIIILVLKGLSSYEIIPNHNVHLNSYQNNIFSFVIFTKNKSKFEENEAYWWKNKKQIN